VQMEAVSTVDNIIVQLFKSKCLPHLYNGLEVCHCTKARISAMLYVVTSCFRTIFNTRSKDIISDCMYFFNCSTIADTLIVCPMPCIGNRLSFRCRHFLAMSDVQQVGVVTHH